MLKICAGWKGKGLEDLLQHGTGKAYAEHREERAPYIVEEYRKKSRLDEI